MLLSEVSWFEKEEEDMMNNTLVLMKSVISGDSRGELPPGNSQLGLRIGSRRPLAVTDVFRRLSYNVSLSYKVFYVPMTS